MSKDITFFKGWIIFIVIVVFMGFIVRTIFDFPVAIVLIFLGASPEKMPYIAKYGSFLTYVLLSFVFYKWSIKTFILSQIKESDGNTDSNRQNA